MKSNIKIETIRHSLAHILAYAVQQLYPAVKFGIGPAIENGFYYDFDFSQVPSSKFQVPKLNDLPKIEKKMKELIKKNIKFTKSIISINEAKKIFKNQPYKLELIKELNKQGESKVSIYKSGEFIDLCKGPHIKSTKEIDPFSFKLTKIAGAYWKGNEKNPMLTRIYALAFGTKKELENYIKTILEAEKRDHRTLGEKLELFMFDKEIGPGLPLWLPKGAILRHTIEQYLYNELIKQGYQWVVTPHMGNVNLWKTSGHWNFYKENMYSPIEIEKDKYLIKPMNCPFHVKIFNHKIRSYKDLPLRLAEMGTVYRYERSGVLHGLTRVRGFTQDDAHIWTTPQQLSEELLAILKYGLKILSVFGFKNYNIYLSTRPEKYAGTLTGWRKATACLKYALNKLNLNYQIDKGGGVFYGPKIDIKIKDCLNREWQCTTIQVDFNLPERFKMAYIDEKGRKKQPIMIHRALLGSLERFIGVLIEHYAGAFPFWLSPVQIVILPLSKNNENYARQIYENLKEKFRTEIWLERETLSKRIRQGEIQKIPYLLIVGDKETKNKTVRLRERNKGDQGEMKLEKFIDLNE